MFSTPEGKAIDPAVIRFFNSGLPPIMLFNVLLGSPNSCGLIRFLVCKFKIALANNWSDNTIPLGKFLSLFMAVASDLMRSKRTLACSAFESFAKLGINPPEAKPILAKPFGSSTLLVTANPIGLDLFINLLLCSIFILAAKLGTFPPITEAGIPLCVNAVFSLFTASEIAD